MKLRLALQEKNVVVVHKPSGLSTYSEQPGTDGARELLEKQLKRKAWPVHRIDRDTCGLLAFALSEPKARELTELFRGRVVKKQYLAVVHGLFPAQLAINEPLERNKEKTKEPALTEATRLAQVEVDWGEKRSYSLVRCEPKTGRFHQVRRHLRFAGHPIVGDPEYGNSWDNDAFRKRFRVERTLLCASSLGFPDREQQKMLRVKTAPDPDFQRVLAAFGWKV